MQIRVRLASISLFAYLGALAGCGDDIPRQQNGGNGGSTGGSGGSVGGSGGSVGGSIAGSGGSGGSGGGGGSIGGSGGRGGTGGTAGTGGRGGTGGTAGTGGTGGTGGTAGTGGRGGTGGTAGTGGTGGTGGTAGTGGGGTGGGGTGGTAGTGGGGTAGGGTGGGGTGGGGTGGQQCYTVAFTAPLNGATLTVADDTNTTCADGFQYTVRITTNAPAGTMVQLFNNGTTLIGTATVASGAATFAVQLASSGQSALSIQFPSTAACSDPTTRSTVTVNCPNTPPTCNIAQPTISATHPALNGVLAPAGDRASQPGSPYQVTFQVTTNAEDGQPVTLAYNNAGPPAATPITLTATASGGSATFGVPLSPDGTYQVIATCKNAANVTGSSQLTSYPVDTTEPNLTVTQPADGHFFGPTELDGQGRFSVCGTTTSTDAAGLPASLGPAVNNLCVALGGSSTCVGTAAVTAINTPACVAVTCPGGAPFNITVQLKDAAGNPTIATIQGVSCASTLPSVQVIAPVSDAPAFTDTSKHILSSTAPVGVRDQSATTPGAQTDVVACTDRSGSAALLVGLSGGTLTQLGSAVTTVAAVPADNCPSGLGFIARFPGVTLPDSIENTDGSVATPTELRVRVTDAVNPASIGASVAVAVWVDPIAPVLTLATPANLCGSFQQSSTTVTQAVTFNAENGRVVLLVTNNGTTTYGNPAFASGIATFPAVAFDSGQNDVTATATDPAGNATTLAPVPCSVTIGSGPVVTFTTPTAGQVLCPAGSTVPGCLQDVDGSTPGWQGGLTVHVTGNGQPLTSGTVTFTVGASTLGTGTLDASGNASLPLITLPEGSLTIVATTSSIPNAGIGTGSVTVNVDFSAPAAPTGLTVNVTDRRGTTMHLAWTAPSDGGLRVGGYQIRYGKVLIDASNFDNPSVATAVTYTGQPATPGQPDGIDVTGLYVESNYHFAVAATDAGGNRSTILSTMSAGSCTCATLCCAAHLNVATLAGVGGASEQFGFQIDSGDVNKLAGSPGPSHSDVLVGSFNGRRAYLYLGAAGTVPTTPSVTFTGDATTTASFGRGVGIIGDVDGDGFVDLAVSDRGSPAHIYIYKGRATWPAAMTNLDANYVITADATYAGSILGTTIARLGDFNGDGADDFALGANLFGGAAQVGRVLVVLGKATGFANITLPDPVNTIVIDGDPLVTTSQFGYRVLGLGHFYNATGGTTLVVSAPGNLSSASGNEGRIYAFHGQNGTAGAIPIASADHVVVGPAGNNRIGAALSNLGPIVGALPSVGSGNPVERVLTPSGNAYVFNGTAATGPFASKVTVYQPGTALSGMALLGGGVSGLDQSFSLLGDATPDLVMAARDSATFVIVDGRTLNGAASPFDANAAAAVTIPVPTGWVATGEAEAKLIPDFDGDLHPDFAIGNAIGTVAGSVVVYW